jgi:hypothetical protein
MMLHVNMHLYITSAKCDTLSLDYFDSRFLLRCHVARIKISTSFTMVTSRITGALTTQSFVYARTYHLSNIRAGFSGTNHYFVVIFAFRFNFSLQHGFIRVGHQDWAKICFPFMSLYEVIACTWGLGDT